MSSPGSAPTPGPAPAPALPGVIAGHALFLFLGLLLGLVGAFLVPTGPRVGSVLLSVGVLVALGGNIAAPALGVAALGRFGGLGPAAGWLIAALAMFTSRPSGTVVLPGAPTDLEVASVAWLLAGLIAAALGALLPAARGQPRAARP